MTELLMVFQRAALPQKLVFLVLIAWSLAALLSLARRDAPPPRAIGALRVAGPALGLLVGAMNAFHMMDTALRLPVSPSVKALAPGVMEISALVGLGAGAGLVAMLVCIGRRGGERPRTPGVGA